MSEELLLQIVSIVMIFITGIISMIISLKSYLIYKEEKGTIRFIFTSSTFFMGVGYIALSIEKLLLGLLSYNDLGIIIAGLAVVSASITVVHNECLAFYIEYLDKYKILTVLTTIFVVIYTAFWLIDPTKAVVSGEVEFGYWFGLGFKITPLVIIGLGGPLLIIPIILYFLYAKKNWNKEPVFSKRIFLFGVGMAILSFTYVTELLGLSLLFSTISRSFFIIGVFVVYWALFKVK